MYEIFSLNSSHKINDLYLTDTFGFAIGGRAYTWEGVEENTPQFDDESLQSDSTSSAYENLSTFWEN